MKLFQINHRTDFITNAKLVKRKSLSTVSELTGLNDNRSELFFKDTLGANNSEEQTTPNTGQKRTNEVISDHTNEYII